MPLFYFDIHDKLGFNRDDTGVDCANLASAQRETLRASSGIIGEETEFWTGDPWTMIVRDDRNAVVATLVFSVQ